LTAFPPGGSLHGKLPGMDVIKMSLKKIIYILVIIIFPVLLLGIISARLKDEKTDIYTVTNLTGQAFLQYQTSYPVNSSRDAGETYKNKSEWIPLTGDMKFGTGVIIKTEIKSSVDLLLDDGMAFRIKEASQVTIDEKPQSISPVQARLTYGNLLANLTVSKLRRLDKNGETGAYKLRINTETAVFIIRGTSFLVSYAPDSHTATLAVHEGNAEVLNAGNFSEQTAGTLGGWKVPGGKKMEVTEKTVFPVLQDITSAEKDELGEVKELQMEMPLFDRINRAAVFNIKPLYDQVLKLMADYGMNNIVSAIAGKSRLSENLPDSLNYIESATGTHRDPWDTDYLYTKINPRRAILISAGPDRIFYSIDDIYMYINI
jgi:hypothetical protein